MLQYPADSLANLLWILLVQGPEPEREVLPVLELASRSLQFVFLERPWLDTKRYGSMEFIENMMRGCEL